MAAMVPVRSPQSLHPRQFFQAMKTLAGPGNEAPAQRRPTYAAAVGGQRSPKRRLAARGSGAFLPRKEKAKSGSRALLPAAAKIAQQQPQRRRRESMCYLEPVLAKLCDLLRTLERDPREAVLRKQFSESQRVRLERWMLAKAANRAGLQKEQQPDKKQVRSSKRPRGEQFPSRGGCSLDEQPAAKKLRSDSKTPSRAGLLKRDLAQKRATQAKTSSSESRGLCSHVVRSTGERLYTAILTVEGLRLLTKETHHYPTAARHRDALVSIRERAMREDGRSFEERFRDAVAGTLDSMGLDVQSMGLRFVVTCSFLWLPRPLLTAPFVASGATMDAGLRAWRRMGEARGHVVGQRNTLEVLELSDIKSAWRRMRETYQAIMVEQGQSAEVVAERLGLLERAQQRTQALRLSRWQQMAHVKAQRRLRQAAVKRCPDDVGAAQRSGKAAAQTRRQERSLQRIERLLDRWRRTEARAAPQRS
eukprot:TRINITY_DN15130_c1_g1_i1.p1 TRINITY_DN15130_c1_g1~~TRINITY_DN15130_c1_g1_i1.p1  ORF type:complete len:476 (-),score=117.50 TRINITY_DN15130_c1_g1_i1:424-1851(-)